MRLKKVFVLSLRVFGDETDRHNSWIDERMLEWAWKCHSCTSIEDK
jgi:hypothetical protein